MACGYVGVSMTSIAAEINAHNTPVQLTPAQFVQEHGGSTRAAAAAAGVSQRTVQRWIAPPGAKQRRAPNRAAKAKLVRIPTRARKIILDGEIRIGSETRKRGITIPPKYGDGPKDLSREQWDKLSELAQADNETAVLHELASIYRVSSLELIRGDVDFM